MAVHQWLLDTASSYQPASTSKTGSVLVAPGCGGCHNVVEPSDDTDDLASKLPGSMPVRLCSTPRASSTPKAAATPKGFGTPQLVASPPTTRSETPSRLAAWGHLDRTLESLTVAVSRLAADSSGNFEPAVEHFQFSPDVAPVREDSKRRSLEREESNQRWVEHGGAEQTCCAPPPVQHDGAGLEVTKEDVAEGEEVGGAPHVSRASQWAIERGLHHMSAEEDLYRYF
eukprot:CAMPEP_0117621372 /NCGR_PEP_ID=MMETSP0784-20121206/87601_1 /TAXON_ID=39447 /ORGANISM="" /LENGTH=227 /DNA_ID=CAMNT_0005425297 /DNA_START=130 /DNA_END=813 /DNA_ORIENTATION=+